MRILELTEKEIHQGNLILVNHAHPLLLEPAQTRAVSCGSTSVLLEKKAALVLDRLLASLNCAGKLALVSGYRTLQEQKAVYSSSLLEHGTAFTQNYVALPGHSEHQTGLAVDLALNQEPIDFIRPCFPEEGICQRFRIRAVSYGFTERYKAQKQNVTQIAAEPWHFRYVGIPHATIMEQEQLCLEEYMDYLKDFPYEGQHLTIQAENKCFEIFYKKAEPEQTEVALPGDAPCQVSGNNTDGFIFTLWR